FTLTATGTRFASGASITWNGKPLTTTFVSDTTVTASIPAALIHRPGSARVAVVNPNPPGASTDEMVFLISSPNPHLTSLDPTRVWPGSAAFTLTVNGAGFVEESTIRWNDTPLATTYVFGTQLTAQVPAANVATEGTAAITVVNPPANGVTPPPSNVLTFTI